MQMDTGKIGTKNPIACLICLSSSHAEPQYCIPERIPEREGRGVRLVFIPY